jgi:hypothetical protein
MLWSCNDGFICISIADGKHPRPPTLAENGSRQTVEAAVWHSLLNARVTDNVHPVADLVFLNYAGYGRKPALS